MAHGLFLRLNSLAPIKTGAKKCRRDFLRILTKINKRIDFMNNLCYKSERHLENLKDILTDVLVKTR